ncbi:MAG: outer membrane beta-barrel protein [Crocinitomicaceae bacterium]|nr:outer membrane beta-barrel protein [Crocinitomicaceae bacterium]
MKRLLLSLSIIALSTSAFAQEAADKKFQAGLVAGVGMNFMKMSTTKLSADGIGSDLTIGANMNFSFNESIGITTGIEIDFETLKYRPSGDAVYYHFRDKAIIRAVDVLPTDVLYEVTTRKQKPIYISIPTMLIFRTKFIGYFRYFGKFGLRTSILGSNKITDTGFEYALGDNPTLTTGISRNNENMSAASEMLFIKTTGGFAGGAEWNFSGTTSLVAEMGFYFGLTKLYWDRDDDVKEAEAGYKDKQFLHQKDDTGLVDNYFSNGATHNQLRFKLSILF